MSIPVISRLLRPSSRGWISGILGEARAAARKKQRDKESESAVGHGHILHQFLKRCPMHMYGPPLCPEPREGPMRSALGFYFFCALCRAVLPSTLLLLHGRRADILR